MALNFISPSGFYRVTFATSVFISYYFLLKPLYYSLSLSVAVICVYLSCCCINKLLLLLLVCRGSNITDCSSVHILDNCINRALYTIFGACDSDSFKQMRQWLGLNYRVCLY